MPLEPTMRELADGLDADRLRRRLANARFLADFQFAAVVTAAFKVSWHSLHP
ncbi:MAG: hypothetical protein LH624_17160 [Cryobacterium sp.]|nr:hypothetical protein [Cryobacterium sp.]